jgi:hypothetical protein
METTIVDLIRKNVLLDKLESDLAIEKAVLKAMDEAGSKVKVCKGDGNFCLLETTIIHNIYNIQKVIAEARIKEIQFQIYKLTPVIQM